MTTYTIRKGDHYSDASILRKIIPHRIDRLERTVRFTESCLNTNTNEQINKLFGFTAGLCSPLWNSVRVGWNSNPNGTISLFAFWHLNGKFDSKFILSMYPNLEFNISILRVLHDSIQIRMNGFVMWEKTFPKRNYGFRLFPYFGGELASPHDIQILMS